MTARRFRKLPVEVEAVHWDGTNYAEVLEFIGLPHPVPDVGKMSMLLKTDSGHAMVELNDWIIKGIAGEFYPCKSGIFEATYEAVT